MSVCQSLWFWAVDRGKGGRRDGEIFPSISRVLVPLADTLPLCCSLLEVCVCVCVCMLAQSKVVVAAADRETCSVFVGLVSRGSGSWIPSVTNQSIILAIEQLYIPSGSNIASKFTFYPEI